MPWAARLQRHFWLVLATVLLGGVLAAAFMMEKWEQPALDPGSKPTPEADPNLAHLQQVTDPRFDDLDGMAQRRVVRALVVRSRTFYFLDGAVQRGLSYEMLKAFEKFANAKLKTGPLKIRVMFLPVTRDQLLPALLAGYGDVAVANLSITPDRQAQVDFSIPTLRDVREVLVTGAVGDAIKSLDDLSGKTVHTRRSSSYYESLSTLNARFEAEDRPPINIRVADEHLEDEELLEMVNAGLIPAVVSDSHKAEFWAQIFDQIQVRDGIVLRDGADIAWALRKNSPKFKELVNSFLVENSEGSLLGNLLFRRYLKETKYLSNALTSSEMHKFRATAPIFQEYANRYHFDWLMIMSQAYQESRLDHSVVSNAGAVGIMQLLPSTAAGKNVGIPNIEQLENNIHAGNKYLRFIRDRYFEPEPMDELNKTLFSFAAYNAGPAKVAKLRAEAKHRGLNPNIWFDNVEVMAAQRIGRETTDYVSNIYKYWIAYSLSRGDLAAVAEAAPSA